jgi:hypothetical protein
VGLLKITLAVGEVFVARRYLKPPTLSLNDIRILIAVEGSGKAATACAF